MRTLLRRAISIVSIMLFTGLLFYQADGPMEVARWQERMMASTVLVASAQESVITLRQTHPVWNGLRAVSVDKVTRYVEQEPAIGLTVPVVYTAPPTKDKLKLERVSIELRPTPRIIIRLVGDPDDFLYPCTPTVPPAAPNPCQKDTPAKVKNMIDNWFSADLRPREFRRLLFDRFVADFPSRFPGGASVQ